MKKLKKNELELTSRLKHLTNLNFSNVYSNNSSYTTSSLIDFDSMYSESSSQKPIVLMYSEESETIRRYFSNYAKMKVGSNFSIVDINSLGPSEDKQLKRVLSKPMEEVATSLLHPQ